MCVIITKFLMGIPLFFLQSILHANIVFPEPRPDHIRSPPWLPTVYSTTLNSWAQQLPTALTWLPSPSVTPSVFLFYFVSTVSCNARFYKPGMYLLALCFCLFSLPVSPSQFHSSCWSAQMPSLVWRLFRPPLGLTDHSLCSCGTWFLPLFDHLFSFCFALVFLCCLPSLPSTLPRTLMASKIRPCLNKSTCQKYCFACTVGA